MKVEIEIERISQSGTVRVSSVIVLPATSERDHRRALKSLKTYVHDALRAANG